MKLGASTLKLSVAKASVKSSCRLVQSPLLLITFFTTTMSSKSTNKRTRSSNSASMKQGTLGFTTFKRTASGSKKRSLLRTASAPVVVAKDIKSRSDRDVHENKVDFLDTSSEDEDPVAGLGTRPRVATTESKSLQKATPVLDIDLHAENPGKWAKAYGEARAKNGNLPTSKHI